MKAARQGWLHYWHGGVAWSRPALLLRLVLLLLAFDVWIDLLPHGGRYGAAGFNVAHFRWLDALGPMPSPALYNACVVMVGVVAFVGAWTKPSRWLLGVIFAGYTYAWMMSLLDSYQHHYLLSVYLCLFVFWPADEDAAEGKVPAWAYALLTACCAVVYTYTAISKSEASWRNGVALQRIAPDGMAPIAAFAERIGMPAETFWPFMGHSVIALQLVIALGYALAPLRDRGSRVVTGVAWIAFLAATSFHVGAEYLNLKVGWFSYYMLITAWVAFLPAAWLTPLAKGFTKLEHFAAATFVDPNAKDGGGPGLGIAFGLAAAGILGFAARIVDVPGAVFGAVLGALVLIAVSVACRAREGAGTGAVRSVVAIVAALGLWASAAGTDLRYDYYRFIASDLRRRGELEPALEAYIKVNRYAPPGKDRRKQEAELRQLLNRPAD